MLNKQFYIDRMVRTIKIDSIHMIENGCVKIFCQIIVQKLSNFWSED